MHASLVIPRLDSASEDFAVRLQTLLGRHQGTNAEIESQVAEIIATVRAEGDNAIFSYTQKFDNVDLNQSDMHITQAEMQAALDAIGTPQREALEFAADRIRSYHQHQLQTSWSLDEEDGTTLGQKITPIQRVGLYVPGGKASYPSSVLMNAIPAKVAGVSELVVVSPTPNGETNKMVLAAAKIAGVDNFLRIGGAQAIAGLAYGTQTIAAVDKITGPGNIYVATAKRQVFGRVGIDMIAGPSEVLIVADQSVDPEWVAMDLFAQAEHDENAQSILLTLDTDFAAQVEQAIKRLLPSMPRAEIIAKSLSSNGAIIIADSDQRIVEIVDHIAPEHLEIFVPHADQLADQISNAGAIFIGPYSAESLGDYCAGPNHVLPTSGTARFSSPLGVYDFQKRTSIIKVSEQGAQQIGSNAAILAREESLIAHARAAELRFKK